MSNAAGGQNPAAPDVRLEVDGKLYGGWTSIDIQRGLEQVAGTFSLELTTRWPGQTSQWAVTAGSPARVLVDGRAVVTGYVDDVEGSWDARSHNYRVTGRDKTCDLVDCCPPSTQIKGASLPMLARQWAALFGIGVVIEAECNKPVPGFKTDEGDTCFEMLEKLARANAVMLTSDGDGRLVITRAGTAKAAGALRLGGNLLHLSAKTGIKERYSDITVKGQSGGSQGWNAAPNAQAKGTARDPSVPRYRPLTLIAEQEEYGSATVRAQHEVNIRYGKGHSITARVNGWYQRGGRGDLWRPNIMTDVQGVDGQTQSTWLIAKVQYKLDAAGWISELTLCPREAFELIPLKPKAKKCGKGDTGWPGLQS